MNSAILTIEDIDSMGIEGSFADADVDLPVMDELGLDPLHQFAVFACGVLPVDCAIVMLQEWGYATSTKPARIIAHVGDMPWDSHQLWMLEEAQTWLVPTYFDKPEDYEVARSLIAMAEGTDRCVLAAMVPPPDALEGRSRNVALLTRHRSIVSLGFDDVILHPSLQDKAMLSTSIAAAKGFKKVCAGRKQALQDSGKSEEELLRMRSRQRKIVYEQIPKLLLPGFPGIAEDLKQTPTAVGEFALVRRLSVNCGVVRILATDAEDSPVMLKAVDKSDDIGSLHVESIYREFRFLSSILRHPSLVRCREIMHGPHTIYAVMDYAGESCMTDVLTAMAGQLFSTAASLAYFDQVTSAIAYCHGMGVALRFVCTDTIFMCGSPGADQNTCKLVDFTNAFFTNRGDMAWTTHGYLPGIAPEVAVEELFSPVSADSWSVGVILLEMAGGLGSLEQSVRYGDPGDFEAAAREIQAYFQSPRSHEVALSTLNGVRELLILDVLQMLLQPDPSQRSTIHAVRRFYPGGIDA